MAKKKTTTKKESTVKKVDTKVTAEKVAPKTTPKTTGVVLFAMGHPYYGYMAHQLAMSLKYGSPDVKIALFIDDRGGQYLDKHKQSVFDKILKMPKEYTTFKGRQNFLKPKVYLNHLSPWDNTLYLDVDMIWNPKRKVGDFLNNLQGIPLTMKNNGHIDMAKSKDLDSKYIIWATTRDVMTAHGFKSGRLYNLSSEVIYFEKSKKTDQFWSDAQELFSKPNVKHVDFADGVPDELPFTIAMAKNKIYPHTDNWRPVFWESFEKKQPIERDLWGSHWALSLGGNIVPKYTKRVYDNLIRWYGNQFGCKNIWFAKDKRSFIQSRQTI